MGKPPSSVCLYLYPEDIYFKHVLKHTSIRTTEINFLPYLKDLLQISIKLAFQSVGLINSDHRV